MESCRIASALPTTRKLAWFSGTFTKSGPLVIRRMVSDANCHQVIPGHLHSLRREYNHST